MDLDLVLNANYSTHMSRYRNRTISCNAPLIHLHSVFVRAINFHYITLHYTIEVPLIPFAAPRKL